MDQCEHVLAKKKKKISLENEKEKQGLISQCTTISQGASQYAIIFQSLQLYM